MNIPAAKLFRDLRMKMKKADHAIFRTDLHHLPSQCLVGPGLKILLPQNQCIGMQTTDFPYLCQVISLHQRAVCYHDGVLVRFTHKYNHSEPAAAHPVPFPHTFVQKNGCR